MTESSDEPSYWFAEGYSVGCYGTRPYEPADLPGDEARAEYQRGLVAGENALTNTEG